MQKSNPNYFAIPLISKFSTENLIDPVFRAVFITGFLLGLFYVSLSVLHLIFLPQNIKWAMSTMAFLSSLVIVTIAFWHHKSGTREDSELALGAIAIVVLLNCTAHIWLEQSFGNTINFVVYSLGLGLLVSSTPWFYTLLIAGLFSWGSAVLMLNLVTPGSELDWLLLFTQFIAIVLHHQRRSSDIAIRKLASTLRVQADAVNSLVKAEELATSDTRTMFLKIVTVASEVLGVETASIWSYHTASEFIRCEEFYTNGDRQMPIGTEIQYDQGPRYFEAIKSYRVIDAEDALADQRTKDLKSYLEENSISSMMDVPIIIKGEIWGVICFEHCGPMRAWELQEQNFAASVADIAALAIQGQENSQLERRSLQAERLESMGVLAGGVAHDFNNLLTVIVGNTELISLKTDNDAIQENVDSIQKALVRAKDLAQQMLAYSGRATFLAQDYDLAEMLEEYQDSWARDMLQNIELQFDLSKNPLSIHCDGTQIRQVIANLLTNARDAGASRIEVSSGLTQPSNISDPLVALSAPPADRKLVYFEIRDNGYGMSKEIMEKVFEPFFTTKSSGSDLGLAATLGIIRAHEGTIELDSTVGKGSTVRVYLPLQTDPVLSPMTSSDEELLPRANHEHLIIVEDEKEIVELSREFLRESFQNIESYSSFSDASQSLEKTDVSEISAMLIDLSLGDGDGVQLIHEIQKKRAKMPIILMSGYDADEALSRLKDKRYVKFLHKPFTHQELILVIEQAIEVNQQLH